MPTSTLELTGINGTYCVESEPCMYGDFTVIHYGMNSRGGSLLIKVARDLACNAHLETEATCLFDVQANDAFASIRPFMPILYDSLVLPEGHRINVMQAADDDFVSITAIKSAYPDGLEPPMAAWVWRRVLGQVMAAELLGRVHGAIVPDHVLVHPVSHEPLHIGWGHSVTPMSCIVSIIERWRDWYPPEVFNREPVTLQTDLYMAGKTMIYLLGGGSDWNYIPDSVPSPLRNCIERCVAEDATHRPNDIHAFMRECTDVIHALWGHTYRRLEMPT